MTENKFHSSGEIVYRILTWIFMATIFLLLVPFYSIVILLIPESFYWLSFIIIPSIYIFLLYLGWKRQIRKDTIIEPVKNSRTQSVLLWLGLALIIFAIAEIGISQFKINYFSGFNIDYILLTLLLIAAILTGIFLPFKKHEKGMSFAAEGIIAGVIINLTVMAFNPVNYDYQGEKLPANYKMPPAMQARFLPDDAYNFEIKGQSMMFAHYAEWSCNVSENDFEKFRKKHGYNFVLNRTNVNEDKEVGPLHHFDADWQKPYYFYNNRHANGGGLTMRYSVPEQKLYGHYSNR
ncbi:MAG: hypothetical protein IKA22_07265 [Lentisphaeria bacterium]|nr:hypothetical protein [Lentisphaeria bacterium]